MQSENRLFDDLAKLMTNAAGAAQGVREEMQSAIRAQMERLIDDLDLITREEFDAVRGMAQKAREENNALKKQVTALEERLAKLES